VSGEQLDVRPPSWRFDIALEVDLIEELARLAGLDQVPETPLPAARRIGGGSDQRLPERSLLQLLAARGYQETISFGFVDPGLQELLLGAIGAVSLRNPIASDLAVMRASLWPGLIRVAQQNLRRQQERLRLFEIATRFEPLANGQVREQKVLAGLALGSRLPEQWGVSKQSLDFYDVKADLEALLAARGARDTTRFVVPAVIPPALHPGRCAAIIVDEQPIGLIGELHPGLLQALDLTYAPILFELDYERISTVPAARFNAISPYPQIRRDISFTVPEAETFSRIAERASVAASTQLKELRVFDVYQGKGVESGRKSVALGLILQDLSRTLTDEDADRIVAAVVAELQSGLNAKLRE
jgi:phenylalanyl-tRNA synthetase beta chain